MTDPDALRSRLDAIEDAPPAERGPLHRFGRSTIGMAQRAFVPDPTTNKTRRADFDPAVHAPEDARDFVCFAIVPVDPRFRPIEREVLAPSKEFNLTRASIQAAGKRLADLDGAFVHIAFEPNETELGTHLGRDGVRRTSTYLKLVEVFDTEDACRAAADGFFKRGGPTDEGGGAPSSNAPPSSGAWTDAERAERGTLLAFLPAIAQGKDYAGFCAAIAADARLSRYFKPDDPDVVGVLAKLGLVPPAPPAPEPVG